MYYDKALLEATRYVKTDGDFGRSAQVALFAGVKAVVRKSDGTQVTSLQACAIVVLGCIHDMCPR